MNWKFTDATNRVVFIKQDGGIDSRLVTDKSIQEWMAAGNTPDPADPLPPPLDASDINNMEKQIKALALCVAQVGGLNVQQIKAMFKSKFDSLP
jgi:hypothetical protein